MIENYDYLIDKHSKEQADKILNIFDKGEPLSEDIVVEIFKLAASWAIESSWLRFPKQKPRDSYPCACKPLFPGSSIPNMFIGEFDVEQDAWFILADDSVAIGGRKSGRITSPLIWQPLSIGKEKAWTRVHDWPTGKSPYYEDAAIIEAMDRRKEMPEDDIMAKAMKIAASVEARHREEISSSPLDIMNSDGRLLTRIGTDGSI